VQDLSNKKSHCIIIIIIIIIQIGIATEAHLFMTIAIRSENYATNKYPCQNIYAVFFSQENVLWMKI
jgi:flagellar basal body-associated protein FliL